MHAAVLQPVDESLVSSQEREEDFHTRDVVVGVESSAKVRRPSFLHLHDLKIDNNPDHKIGLQNLNLDNPKFKYVWYDPVADNCLQKKEQRVVDGEVYRKYKVCTDKVGYRDLQTRIQCLT